MYHVCETKRCCNLFSTCSPHPTLLDFINADFFTSLLMCHAELSSGSFHHQKEALYITIGLCISFSIINHKLYLVGWWIMKGNGALVVYLMAQAVIASTGMSSYFNNGHLPKLIFMVNFLFWSFFPLLVLGKNWKIENDLISQLVKWLKNSSTLAVEEVHFYKTPTSYWLSLW